MARRTTGRTPATAWCSFSRTRRRPHRRTRTKSVHKGRKKREELLGSSLSQPTPAVRQLRHVLLARSGSIARIVLLIGRDREVHVGTVGTAVGERPGRKYGLRAPPVISHPAPHVTQTMPRRI